MMGFETLLGNDRLKQNIAASLARGRISHFYVISGPAGSGKHTLARLLAAAILCRAAGRPCLDCGSCRKVLSGSHPDFITVDDPEKKTVPVDLIRQARADMYVQPNESDHKIYLFPRAQDMAIPGQNALLKVLEEPPAYGVFILLTDNPEKLLPTVRSRCTELALTALDARTLERELARRFPQADSQDIRAAAQRSGGFLGQALVLLDQENAASPQAEAFAASYAARDAVALLQTLVPMEKWKRDVFIREMTLWQEILHEALLCRSGMDAVTAAARQIAAERSSQELHQAISHIQKAIEYAQGNISVAAICGWLEWALR